MDVLRQSGCIRTIVVVFGQKWLYSDKDGFIPAKRFYSGKSGCDRAKVVVFWQKCLYSGKVVVL